MLFIENQYAGGVALHIATQINGVIEGLCRNPVLLQAHWQPVEYDRSIIEKKYTCRTCLQQLGVDHSISPKRAHQYRGGLAENGMMPFGKFRGWRIVDIMTDYLQWVSENIPMKEPLFSLVHQELLTRTTSSTSKEGIAIPKGITIH